MIQKNNSSKYLSLLLRHSPEKANLTVLKDGWVTLEQLFANTEFTLPQLQQIVKDDSKQRYSFSEDGLMIRANQGHSIDVEIAFKKAIPPTRLYHGTAEQNVKSILKTGLFSQSRQYVHLSHDIKTATSVGKRHGAPVILEIDTTEMAKQNLFFISENGIWLAKEIPTKFIRILQNATR